MPTKFLFVLFFIACRSIFYGQSIEIKFAELILRLDSRPEFLESQVNYSLIVNNKQPMVELQLDEGLIVDSVFIDRNKVAFKRDINKLRIERKRVDSAPFKLSIHYSGKPKPAIMPPWKGGWVVRKDEKNRQWITVACQQEGAQLWWPSFEDKCIKPLHTVITGIHSSSVKFVANGKKKSEKKLNDLTTSTTFEVTYPINSYNISFGLGHYDEINDSVVYPSGNKLPVHIYVLDYEVDKCKKHLLPQIQSMLLAYNLYLGEYPFTHDGFGILQTPYAGMEHQSGIAYGNGFKNGYLGIDYSGLELPFDFILIHETGHEWFGNLISTNTVKDFWINEGFCTYAEKLYVRAMFGDSIADEYMYQKRKMVKNEQPIATDSSKDNLDQYNKGALLIHTIEKCVNDSFKWALILKKYLSTFSGKCVTTEDVIRFFDSYSTKDYNFKKICHQFLFDKSIPELLVKTELKKGKLEVRYRLLSERKITLPVEFNLNGKKQSQIASNSWKVLTFNGLENYDAVNVNTKAAYFDVKYVRK